ANRILQLKMAESIKKIGCQVFYARPEFCTDNGAMIALAGMIRLKHGVNDSMNITVKARWPLVNLSPLAEKNFP
ncbi:MAG: tRNA (adenosine(37)-N6)-threonylcarbamoyltransferase complex transferase subunit TsaD, partial [Arsenophonus sp. NC-QC1-MAG3]